MTDRTTLDVDFCRAFFPPIGNGLAYLENAGGSYVPEPVIEAVTGYMRESQCQPGWTFASSRQARARIDAGLAFAAGAINAGQDEVVVGPSTTLNAITTNLPDAVFSSA